MKNFIEKGGLRIKRRRRVRAKVSGSESVPRLAIFKSLKGIYAQIIDDEKGVSLVAASLKDIKGAKNDIKGSMAVGEAIAKKAKSKKIEKVVFDRAGYKYHGKVKSFADGARKGGLQF